MEYDMEDFFRSCVALYAELTDTDPATYPAVGTPFGPEMASLLDGRGGPQGTDIALAMEALAEGLGVREHTKPCKVINHGEPIEEGDMSKASCRDGYYAGFFQNIFYNYMTLFLMYLILRFSRERLNKDRKDPCLGKNVPLIVYVQN